MSAVSDYNIFQNHLIGAHALWAFCKSYQENSLNRESPPLLLLFPVLPTVFNKRSRDAIKSRNFKEGSLYRALTDQKDLFSGLNDRIKDTTDITFQSLFMASSAGLVIYDKETTSVYASRKAELLDTYHGDYSDILQASKRIGAWYGKLSIQEIIDLFDLNF